MPKQIHHIFNRKILKSAINAFDFKKIHRKEDIRRILLRWKNLIDSHRLKSHGETSIHGDFLIDIFSQVLGYKRIVDEQEEWNLSHEQKTYTDSSKADGALGFFAAKFQDIRVVIELKSSGTDLDAKQNRRGSRISPVEQAFAYSHKSGKKCRWIIVSNYDELRLYSQSSSREYENFRIARLYDNEEFERFYFLLSAETLIKKDGDSLIDSLYKRNEADEEAITKDFYRHYKQIRVRLFEHIKQHNPGRDKLLLLEKTQKLLDRFIFICFCEDTRLLPERVFRKLVNRAKESFAIEDNKMWRELKGLFHGIDRGLESHGINAFNGSLFAKDTELDSLTVTDDILEELVSITDYDFESDLNVNILGHIFEQSIADLEDFRAELKGKKPDRKNGRRKKEGIFYTPEHITGYIIENTVGEWLEDRKKELGFFDLPPLTADDYHSIKIFKNDLKFNKNIHLHIDFWEAYKKILMEIKILDPACGSGAFLNQAFDFLYKEGQRVNSHISRLKGGQRSIFDLDKHILRNNLFGVDLNKESVEITKLSLWIKTANKHSPLTMLNDNIKCGNSLIDDPGLCGKKAFKWESAFEDITESGGFDIVISNPPYGASLSVEEKNLFKKIYSNVHSRMPDTFNYFISRSLGILKKDGYLSFIVPNNLLYQNEYEKARGLLLKENRVIDVINLGDNVFEGATVPTCLFRVKKEKEHDYSFTYRDLRNHEKKKPHLIPGNAVESYSKSDVLKAPSFIFGVGKEKLGVLEKVSHLSYKVADITREVANGIQPTGDRIFRVDNTFAAVEKLEPELLKKVIVGGDFNRYELFPPGKVVIYTNKNTNIDEFPKIKAYLEPYKDQLSKKRETRKGILPWWSLHWPRYAELFEEPKIVLRQTSDNIIAYFDDEGYYAMNNVIVLKLKAGVGINYKFALACLNSTLTDFIYKNITQEGSRAFAEVKPKNVKKLFIPKMDPVHQSPIVKKTEEMIASKKKRNETVDQFNRFIASTYGIKKLSSRLKDFYLLSFTEFIEELKKQKVTLTRKDEFDMIKVFEVQKSKTMRLNSIIDGIDHDIDKIINRFYGFSKEEDDILKSG